MKRRFDGSGFVLPGKESALGIKTIASGQLTKRGSKRLMGSETFASPQYKFVFCLPLGPGNITRNVWLKADGNPQMWNSTQNVTVGEGPQFDINPHPKADNDKDV